MRLRVIALVALAVTLGATTAACSPDSPEEAARSDLSSVIDASIEAFDSGGGSETTSIGEGQYALIFDPTASEGKQVVTVDLADATSPAFGSTSAIAVHSLRSLVSSPEFATFRVSHSDDDFTAEGDGFRLDLSTQNGLIIGFVLTGGSPPSAVQSVLMTYGISPEARTLFESAR